MNKNFYQSYNRSMIGKLKKMSNKDTRTLVLSFVCLGAFVVAFLLLTLIYHFCNITSDYNHRHVLDKHFTVRHNQTTYTDVDLSEFTLEAIVKRGDTISFSTTLPNTNIRSPYLYIYTIHSTVDVYVGPHLIYTYGAERYKQDLMLGYGPHAIPLPYDYAGQKLTVKMQVLTSDSFTDFKVPYIISGVNLFRMQAMTAILPLFSDVTLIIMGLLLGFFSIVFSFSIPELRRIAYLSGFAMGMGFWTLCANDTIWLFTPSSVLRAYIEYPSLYVSPLLFLLYVKETMLRDKTKGFRRFYVGLLYAHVIFIVIAGILHFTGIRQFPEVLGYYHVLLVFSIAVILYDILHSIVNGSVQYKFMTAGICILIFTAVFDLAHFNLQKYNAAFFSWTYQNHIAVALVLFVFLTILDFFLMMRRNIYAASYTEALEKIAYTDVLTGLPNRRRAEDALDEVDAKDYRYMIISIDLNYLKKTNDNLGHDKGDQLISDFASILKQVYGEGSFMARMGGDEFMVILSDLQTYDPPALQDKTDRLVAEYNEASPDLVISYASGTAVRGECDMTASRDYLKLADIRMYENKMAMKATRSV